MNVVVTFGGTSDHSKKIVDASFTQWSGNVYQGTLDYRLINCVTGVVRKISCDVKTGGYHMSADLKKPDNMPGNIINKTFPGEKENFWSIKPWMTGSDLAWPPGNYSLETAIHTGNLTGFRPKSKTKLGDIPIVIEGKTITRTFMKMHYKVRTNGSSGCIVFTDQEQWDKFTGWMENRLKDCPTLRSKFPDCRAECEDEKYVPLKVDFDVLPVFKLRGSEGDGTVGACSARNLAETTRIGDSNCCDGCGN
jgi:hypothetical protein